MNKQAHAVSGEKSFAQSSRTRKIVESGMLLALGFILSMIKYKVFPNGGSVTLASMLPIVILAYKYGLRWGCLCGAIHGCLQMLEDGVPAPPVQTATSYVLVILLDYIIAWMLVGLAALVRKALQKPGFAIAVGSVIGISGRMISSTLSSMIVWRAYLPEGASLLPWALGYNATVMVPEMIITAAVGGLLFSSKALQKQIAFRPLKGSAT